MAKTQMNVQLDEEQMKRFLDYKTRLILSDPLGRHTNNSVLNGLVNSALDREEKIQRKKQGEG